MFYLVVFSCFAFCFVTNEVPPTKKGAKSKSRSSYICTLIDPRPHDTPFPTTPRYLFLKSQRNVSNPFRLSSDCRRERPEFNLPRIQHSACVAYHAWETPRTPHLFLQHAPKIRGIRGGEGSLMHCIRSLPLPTRERDEGEGRGDYVGRRSEGRGRGGSFVPSLPSSRRFACVA